MQTKELDPLRSRAPEPEEVSGRPTRNIGEAERWASMLAGGALFALGLSRRSIPGALVALAGVGLIQRGRSAHCPFYQRLGFSSASAEGMELALDESITVNRPRDEVYRFYRDFENHPRFMKHIKFVSTTGEGRTHWAMKIPGGPMVEWDARTVEEVPGERIRWRSIEGSDLVHHGEVWFEDAPGDRGTEVHVHWKYLPPGKTVGALFAKLLEGVTTATLRQELRRFKQLVETGEVATIEGQPSGRARLGTASERSAKPAPLLADTSAPPPPVLGGEGAAKHTTKLGDVIAAEK